MASSFACPRPSTRRSTPGFQGALSKLRIWKLTWGSGRRRCSVEPTRLPGLKNTWAELVVLLHVYNYFRVGYVFHHTLFPEHWNMHCIRIFMLLYICVSSNPIVWILVTERRIFIVTWCSGISLFITILHMIQANLDTGMTMLVQFTQYISYLDS